MLTSVEPVPDYELGNAPVRLGLQAVKERVSVKKSVKSEVVPGQNGPKLVCVPAHVEKEWLPTVEHVQGPANVPD